MEGQANGRREGDRSDDPSVCVRVYGGLAVHTGIDYGPPCASCRKSGTVR